MRDPAYSTKTAFDWILSHYLMKGIHYAWVAPEFFPYRLKNSYSSNPLKLYEAFYAAWKDNDEFSPMVAQKRMGLRKSIDYAVKEGRLQSEEHDRLKILVDTTNASLFYPIVYRVDLSKISQKRLKTAGSGASSGSSEFLITDLRETEFDLLFGHFREDDEMRRMVLDPRSDGAYRDSYEILEFFESRRVRGASQ